jgi:parallel beta helix pectate lyase-like protein
MNKFRFTLKLFLVATFVFAFASIAQAQATRTWVSGVGDDVNPCSRTAPCKTFAGAISKTAVNGEIDSLDPGGFGAVTITKSITIDGTTGAGFGSILAAGTNGVNVNDSATATPGTIIVVLRNLSIQGAGTGLVGVNITSGKSVHVENCSIQGFKAGSGRGISDTRNNAGLTGHLFVEGTDIRNNTGSGIAVVPGGSVTLINVEVDNCHLVDNGTSVASGFVAVGTTVKATISRTTASRNQTFGIAGEGGSKISIDHCIVSFNGVGVDANGAATEIRMSNTVVTRNVGNGLGLSGGAIRSYGNNMLRGNGTDTNPTNTDLPQ